MNIMAERVDASESSVLDDYRCDVKAHGERQVEIKSWYPVIHSRYSLFDFDLYLFFPRQLGIDGQRYGTAEFIRNSKTYSRLSTPTLSLDQAIDPAVPESPFYRMTNFAGTTDEIIYEIKTLCNIFRRYTREVRHGFERTPEACGTTTIVNHLDAIGRFTAAVRKLFETLLQTYPNTDIEAAIRWADETISIKAEIEYYKLYRSIHESESREWVHSDVGNTVPRLVAGLQNESRYREEQGYPSVVEADDTIQESIIAESSSKTARQSNGTRSTAMSLEERNQANERTLYREGMLKKWSQSALYLTTDERLGEHRFGHTAAAIAAAIAMSFAVFATLFANRFFPSYSVPWALLIVLAYIFKDRIKELVRTLLTATMPRKAADVATRMIDPASGRKIGMAKSLVRVESQRDIPDPVTRKRTSVHTPLRPIVPPDTVLHVHKRTRLHGKRLAEVHTRTASITEILRISIDEWLEAMDDPTNQLTYAGRAEPVRVTANRVYHLHMILTLAHSGKRVRATPKLFHYLLVATRNGVLRIEDLNKTPPTATGVYQQIPSQSTEIRNA